MKCKFNEFKCHVPFAGLYERIINEHCKICPIREMQDRFELETKEIVKCVPFQLCPKCNGEGKIDNPNLSTTSLALSKCICDLCNGAMVIPMAVIPEKNEFANLNFK